MEHDRNYNKAIGTYNLIVKPKVFGHFATTLTEGQTGPAFA